MHLVISSYKLSTRRVEPSQHLLVQYQQCRHIIRRGEFSPTWICPPTLPHTHIPTCSLSRKNILLTIFHNNLNYVLCGYLSLGTWVYYILFITWCISLRSCYKLFTSRGWGSLSEYLMNIFIIEKLCNLSLIKVKSALSGLRQFLATENPFKMMKNAFYFTLKALFVFKIFKFLFWLSVMWKTSLIRKISLISKFMTLRSG